MKIEGSFYGNLRDGREVRLYTMVNDNNVVVKITNYGGIITSLLVPDKKGNFNDVVLGFDHFENYLGNHPYFGAIIGRYANRIAEGRFKLNGKEYRLEVNNGPNHLHGGGEGFDKKIWKYSTISSQDEVTLKLTLESGDLEEGYPGNLSVEVHYTLNNKNELAISYFAKTDKDTIINLTNHSYFNLNIKGGDIKGHQLQMNCLYYTPVDQYSIPTGEIRPVQDSPYDFTEEKSIEKDFDKLKKGYDHNYVINKEENQFEWFAKVYEPVSGRVMEVGTSQPGVQLYTANYVNNISGKEGIIYNEQSALCLETQHFPDSPNKPQFPSVVLRKGEQYKHKTIYRFGVEAND